MICLTKVNQFHNLFCGIHLLTEALKGECIGYSGRRFANLDGLPDTPATNILNFRGLTGKILDFMPFQYRHTNLVTQVLDIKHFTKESISGITANVRRSEWANDGYTLGQYGKVDEIPLGKMSKAWGEWRKKDPTYVMTSLARDPSRE